VTRSGTNEFSGFHVRPCQVGWSRASARRCFGTAIHPRAVRVHGRGPIIRDRLHVFLAPEWQRLNSPAEGPYLGNRLPVYTSTGSPQDLERFQSVMRGYGLDAGGAGPVAFACSAPKPVCASRSRCAGIEQSTGALEQFGCREGPVVFSRGYGRLPPFQHRCHALFERANDRAARAHRVAAAGWRE
jgi:hypothetical protein